MSTNSVQNNVLLLCAALTTAALVIVSTSPTVAQQPQSLWTGAYSAAQATRGAALYARYCASCHNKDLSGTDRGPAVGGPAFTARWSSKPLGDLLDYMQGQMPVNSPRSLTRHQNADMLAYMLQRSGAAAGAKDLWVDGPEGGFPAKHGPEFGTFAAKSTTRAEAFYTVEQAKRGRLVFNRHCAHCHGIDAALSTPEDLLRLFPRSLGGRYLERVFDGRHLYPNVFALYSKMQSMPLWDIHSISAQERVDAIAYILQANSFPAGSQEVTVDTDAMRLMMVNEPGFERIFNGGDLTGWDITSGYGCGYTDGCVRHAPLDIVRVENKMIVCECQSYGHMITDRKYRNFTLRFDNKFERPVDLKPEDDERIFSGGGGYKIFSDLPASRHIEVEGRHRDLLEIVRPGGAGMMGAVDADAKWRVMRPLGQWNSIEISAKDGEIRTMLNGVPISSVKPADYNYADFKDGGHIMFQTEGTKMYWRNIRIRVD